MQFLKPQYSEEKKHNLQNDVETRRYYIIPNPIYKYQGPAVRKPINANPRLKVNRGLIKAFSSLGNSS